MDKDEVLAVLDRACGALRATKKEHWYDGLAIAESAILEARATIAAWNVSPSADVVGYRLLRDGETILATDEHLNDDASTWRLVAGSIGAGCTYYGGLFMPMRRQLAQQGGESKE